MANVNQIGIPELELGLLQPKQKNKWRISFIGTNAKTPSSPTPLSMQAVTVTRPTQTYDVIEFARYNGKGTAAGKHTWEPITLVVEDDAISSALAVIQVQNDKQMHVTGGSGGFLDRGLHGSRYKFGMDIAVLNGNEQVLDQWALDGCWFQSINYGELDYTTGEPVQITMTINYDAAKTYIREIDSSLSSAVGNYVFIPRRKRQEPTDNRPEGTRQIVLPPVVPVVDPVPDPVVRTEAELVFDTMSREFDTFTVVTDGEGNRTVVSGQVNVDELPEGASFEVLTVDEIDTQYPELSIREYDQSFTNPSTGEQVRISNPPTPRQIAALRELGLEIEPDLSATGNDGPLTIINL